MTNLLFWCLKAVLSSSCHDWWCSPSPCSPPSPSSASPSPATLSTSGGTVCGSSFPSWGSVNRGGVDLLWLLLSAQVPGDGLHHRCELLPQGTALVWKLGMNEMNSSFIFFQWLTFSDYADVANCSSSSPYSMAFTRTGRDCSSRAE